MPRSVRPVGHPRTQRICLRSISTAISIKSAHHASSNLSASTIDVMGLLARLAPDVKTLARVREANPKSVRRLCAPCVPFCRRAGWVSGDGVAIEGSQCQAVVRRKAVWAAQRRANEQARLAAEIGHSLDQPDGADESDEIRVEGDAVRSARTLLDETGRPSVALTEPEARSMSGAGPGDHVQRAVDADHHLIVHQ